MADYITPPITTDPEDLFQSAVDRLQALVPSWQPADGNLDTWLQEVWAQIVAQIAESASDTQTSIFRWFGKNLANVPPIEAVAATGSITVTMADSAGYTVSAGSNLAVGEIDFQTVADLVVAPGDTVGTIGIIATEEGEAGNVSGAVQFLDEYDFIASVSLATTPTGGSDAEPDSDYLDRLRSKLRLLTPRPILPDDFAQLAEDVPEVSRALCIDGYDPTGPSTGNARMVTVFAIDEAGQPVSSGAHTALDVLFNGDGGAIPALREVTFAVFIDDPTYTTVNFAYTAKAWPGWDPDDVKAAADAALAAYVDPASWGQPTFGESKGWVNETKVRYLEVAAVLNSVEGLHYIETLTVNGGTSDVTLTGVAPLPELGTITSTVDAA